MANWETKCDKLVKEIVLARGHCERCGNSQCQLHHHHLIFRNVKVYRHDLNNIVCLCAMCHQLAPYSAHHDISGYRKWLKTTDYWEWYEKHTVKSIEIIGGQEVEKYRSVKSKHIGDETEYWNLKELIDG